MPNKHQILTQRYWVFLCDKLNFCTKIECFGYKIQNIKNYELLADII